MKKEQLVILLSLLNDVETRGSKNLNNLLASIQLVQKAIDESNLAQAE